MTPLFEEIGGYVEDINVFPKKSWKKAEVITPKSVILEDVHNKLGHQGSITVSFMIKSRIPGSYLLDRFGHNQGRQTYEVESPNPKSWESKKIFAFIIYFRNVDLPKWSRRGITYPLDYSGRCFVQWD